MCRRRLSGGGARLVVRCPTSVFRHRPGGCILDTPSDSSPEEDERGTVLDILNSETPVFLDYRVAPAFSRDLVILAAQDDLDVQSVIHVRLVPS
jgi:hypothetical protein